MVRWVNRYNVRIHSLIHSFTPYNMIRFGLWVFLGRSSVDGDTLKLLDVTILIMDDLCRFCFIPRAIEESMVQWLIYSLWLISQVLIARSITAEQMLAVRKLHLRHTGIEHSMSVASRCLFFPHRPSLRMVSAQFNFFAREMGITPRVSTPFCPMNPLGQY